jgi:hypothetical protein
MSRVTDGLVFMNTRSLFIMLGKFLKDGTTEHHLLNEHLNVFIIINWPTQLQLYSLYFLKVQKKYKHNLQTIRLHIDLFDEAPKWESHAKFLYRLNSFLVESKRFWGYQIWQHHKILKGKLESIAEGKRNYIVVLKKSQKYQ